MSTVSPEASAQCAMVGQRRPWLDRGARCSVAGNDGPKAEGELGSGSGGLLPETLCGFL